MFKVLISTDLKENPVALVVFKYLEMPIDHKQYHQIIGKN